MGTFGTLKAPPAGEGSHTSDLCHEMSFARYLFHQRGITIVFSFTSGFFAQNCAHWVPPHVYVASAGSFSLVYNIPLNSFIEDIWVVSFFLFSFWPL